jgi:hypothetical protein
VNAPPESVTSTTPLEARALKLVLAASLERPVVQACLGVEAEAVFWSSTLYACAAQLAAHSGLVWSRLAWQLDRRLAPWLHDYASRTPLERVAALSHPELAQSLSAEELAAAVWATLREREPRRGALDVLLGEAERLLRLAPPGLRRSAA